VLTRAHAALAANETEVAERFRQYCLPTFREGWRAPHGTARLAPAVRGGAVDVVHCRHRPAPAPALR
jgi:hypothetical protein